MKKRRTDRDRKTMLAFMWCQDKTLVYKANKEVCTPFTHTPTHTHTHTQTQTLQRWLALFFRLTTRVQPEKLSAAMAMAMA